MASRELRNHTRDLLRRVEASENVVITVDGRPVAVLRPVGARPRWIARADFVHRFSGRQANPALTKELRMLSPDTTDDLPGRTSHRSAGRHRRRDPRPPTSHLERSVNTRSTARRPARGRNLGETARYVARHGQTNARQRRLDCRNSNVTRGTRTASSPRAQEVGEVRCQRLAYHDASIVEGRPECRFSRLLEPSGQLSFARGAIAR